MTNFGNMAEKQEKDLALYGWMFTYNAYTEKWAAFHRRVHYFVVEGTEENGVYTDTDLPTLINRIRKISKNGGNDEKEE